MASDILYCEVCSSSSNTHPSGFLPEYCSGCKSSSKIFFYLKRSDHYSEIEAKNSEIATKDFEIRNLKSEMSQSEIKAKKDLENLRENLDTFAGKLYAEKDFADVKIVCNEKTFACHKAVLSCQSEVLKTMIRNKSLTEKQAEVMEIEENDFNSEAMEQILFYFYHGKVQDITMINTDLLRAADKYEAIGLMDMCAKYLEFNLSLENALDVLTAAELTNQKSLFDSAAKFVRKNQGKMNKTGACKEMLEKDPKFIANVMSKIFDINNI